MYNSVFFFIISIVSFSFILARFIDIKNSHSRSKPLPDTLRDVYDETKYAESQNYGKIRDRMNFAESIVGFFVTIVILVFGFIGILYEFSLGFTTHPILSSLIFFGLLFILSELISVPFDIYNTFVIEQQFGFNKTTPKIFISDLLKSFALSVVIGGIVLYAIMWFYIETGDYFVLWTLALVGFIMIFSLMFYSNLIVPLFNKQKQLVEGELRNAIELFARKAGFTASKIFVIDGSKRSTKANAYFTGFGPKKRIVLYDTLIQDLSKEEIVAVLAHEIGHYKLKHTLSSAFLSIIHTAITLCFFYILSKNELLPSALGYSAESFALSLIAFGLLFSPAELIIGLFFNKLSRNNEFAADKFAAKFGYGEYLISGLKKLARNNLTNLTPHPLYVMFYFSHPPLEDRINAIKKYHSSGL